MGLERRVLVSLMHEPRRVRDGPRTSPFLANAPPFSGRFLGRPPCIGGHSSFFSMSKRRHLSASSDSMMELRKTQSFVLSPNVHRMNVSLSDERVRDSCIPTMDATETTFIFKTKASDSQSKSDREVTYRSSQSTSVRGVTYRSSQSTGE